jgi:hypothetical protein
VTRHIFAALFLARFDGKERLVVLVLTGGPVPERSLLEQLQADLDRAVVRRAIQRLRRDRVVEAAQGVLSLTSPTHWPSHRIEACERSIAGRLAPYAGDDRGAMPVKLHQAPVDDGRSYDWLDGPPIPDHVDEACSGCDKANKILTSPHDSGRDIVTLAREFMWARSHLATCPRSPKAASLR